MEASTPTFGELSFSQEEKTEIRNLLGQKLNKDEITYRQGPSGRMCVCVCMYVVYR